PTYRASLGLRRESKNGHSGALEHLAERDERQADERGRVACFDALDQGDPQALGLGTGGAIVRLLASQVGFYLPVVELPKIDPAPDHAGPQRAGGGIEQRYRGIELRRIAAQHAQLLEGRFMVPGFAERMA